MSAPPLSLRDYQVAHLAHFMSTPVWADFSDPGVGKTPPVCVYLGYAWQEQKWRSIWTMPKSLLKKNREELLRWSGLKEEDVIIVDGTPKQRAAQMRSDAKVFLMGFQCFASNWPELCEIHPDIAMMVGDEWHLGFKGPNSGRTRSMYEFWDRPETKSIGAMSGTIVDGRLDSAYSLIHVADPGAYIGGYDGFMMAHAMVDDFGKVVAWVNLGRVREMFSKIAIRRAFEEAYGKEAKIMLREPVEMTELQRKYYLELEETAVVELEESWLDGSLPGVALARARQLMECPQIFGPPLDKIGKTGKEEALDVHLEHHKATGKPLVIFAAVTESIERIVRQCEAHGLRVGKIHGGVPAKRRFQIDTDFQEGKLDVVVASAATAGVGFNWPHVDHIIFMSMDFMDSNFVQAYRRAIRGTRTTPVLIRVMEYTNSLDQMIFAIVERKSKLAADVDPTKEALKIRTTAGAQKAAAPEKTPEAPKPLKGKPSMASLIKKPPT